MGCSAKRWNFWVNIVDEGIRSRDIVIGDVVRRSIRSSAAWGHSRMTANDGAHRSKEGGRKSDSECRARGSTHDRHYLTGPTRIQPRR
jgi:hypothetical protein